MQKEKLIRGSLYALVIFFILSFLTLLVKDIPYLSNFVHSVEVKTLDTRQVLLANLAGKNQTDNSKVALIVIDDNSLESLSKQYGFWPWNRNAYADIIKYVEKDGADTIILDFLFLGFQQGNEDKDWNFIKEVKKHDNIYLSLNFDYRENEDNKKLPLYLAANLDNKSDIDFKDFDFPNYRKIMPELFNDNQNIGFINYHRDDDGISRHAPSFFIYQEKYYPYMPLKITQNYLLKHKIINSEKFIITPNKYLVMGNKQIKLDNDGYLVLNWFDKSGVEEISFADVIQNKIEKGYFKDKIVAIGTSAVALADTKSTPIDRYMPGIKIQTTYINNLLNDNVISPVGIKCNLLIAFIFVLLTSILLFKINSNVINALSVIGVCIIYVAISLFALAKFNLWIDIAYPIFLILSTYTIVYVVKFIRKSEDFEKTYKLATTDGLTELYNHRYFQEQMLALVDTSKRYNTNFSLIMIDIDFFKKFNDKFGHQTGDAVLRKVAEILKKTVRASDIVARYGGEEMAVILPNTNLEDAVITANKICKAVNEKPFKLLDDIECIITISLGVATYPIHGQVQQELIEIADRGLYNAKENGRNQVGKVGG